MSSPPGISPYLKAASEAEAESLEEHKRVIGFVDELDALFRAIATGRMHAAHPVTNFLGMNSHAAFLAAVSTALRGQAPATFMILRGCVESAAYAFLVGLDESDGDLWIKRREKPEEMKARFTVNRAVQNLSFDPHLAAQLKDTHQWMIEFGGHPNPRSIIDHIRFKDELPEGNPISLIYIQAPDSLATFRSLSACIENGCLAVTLLCHAIPDHPEMEKTFDRVWPLFHAFQRFMADEGYLDEEYLTAEKKPT